MICDAIAARRLIRFDYDGADRITEVYAHGFNQSKVETIRAFQVAGSSNVSNPTGWKFFLVSKMQSIEILEGHFHDDRPGGDDAAHDLVIIHCQY